MPQRRRRPRLLSASRARPTGGFLIATAGQPRQCYQRSIRNPARASRSFNSVIRLSLAGTMFATVVARRWFSLTVRHGWFGCAVRGLLHGGEICRVRVAEWRHAPRTRCATSPCACNVTWAATPHFSGAYACPTLGSQCSFFAKAVAVMGGGTEQAVAVFSDCKDVLKSVLNQCAAPYIVVV